MARKFVSGKPTVGDTPVVIETRTITATAPVTIAGTTSADLSADRTIAVTAATTSAAGVVQLEDSVASTSTTKAATPNSVKTAYDAAILKSLVDAKGDLLVGSADNAVARLAVGATDGHVLTVDAAATNGIKWAASTGGGGSYATTIGDGSATTFTVTHGLATRDVIVRCYVNSGNYQDIQPTVFRPTTSTVSLQFMSAPASNAIRVLVQA